MPKNKLVMATFSAWARTARASSLFLDDSKILCRCRNNNVFVFQGSRQSRPGAFAVPGLESGVWRMGNRRGKAFARDALITAPRRARSNMSPKRLDVSAVDHGRPCYYTNKLLHEQVTHAGKGLRGSPKFRYYSLTPSASRSVSLF